MENNRFWYAVLRNEEDNDWGTGSFNYDEAVATALKWGYEIIRLYVNSWGRAKKDFKKMLGVSHPFG